MSQSEIIAIEMTPFLFEDGNTYYFQITDNSYSSYLCLYVYEKVITKVKRFMRSEKTIESMVKLNDVAKLIDRNLDSDDVKSHITSIVKSRKALYRIKGWDGYVGSEDNKISLQRENKIKDIFNKEF